LAHFCLLQALPEDLLLRALAPLPLLHRLRAAASCSRLKRLLYTPALRAATRPAHLMTHAQPLGEGNALTSPDGRFRFTFQEDANVVLYYAAHGHVRGVDGAPVWALQSVGGVFGYTPGRLALTREGRLVACEPRGAVRWASAPDAAAPAGTVGPYRLVVRNEGDVAILDAEDRLVWVAVPERRPWLDDDRRRERRPLSERRRAWRTCAWVAKRGAQGREGALVLLQTGHKSPPRVTRSS
jgi:hypothetical protein